MISSLSKDFESGQFKLFPILSDHSPIVGFCSQTLVMYIGSYLGQFQSNKYFFQSHFESPTRLISMFYKEKQSILMKTFPNWFFGDDFAFNGISWMYHDLFHVSGEKLHQTLPWIIRERPSRSLQRSKKCGYLLILNVEWIRKLSSHGIHYSKHSKIKSFKSCCRMIHVLNWAKSYTKIFPSLGYIGKLLEL